MKTLLMASPVKIDIHLVSTDYKYLENKNFNNLPSNCNLIISNQLLSVPKRPDSKSIDIADKGVSLNRNRCLEQCSNEISLLCDDDIAFTKAFESTLIKAHAEYPDADFICFKLITPEGEDFRSYGTEISWLNKFSALKVPAMEMSFKTKSVLNAGLKFDTNFGPGCKYDAGEENVFITDALKKGLKVLYYPAPMLIHPKESSGSNLDSKKLAFARGAVFSRIYGPLTALIFTLGFCLKKKLQLKSNFPLFRNISSMLSGIRHFSF